MWYNRIGYTVTFWTALLWTFLAFNCVTARTEPLFSLRETYLTVKHYTPNGHNPLMPEGSVLNKGLNLTLVTDMYRYFYSKNIIWSLADQHQFRWIGWNYSLGVRLLPFLDLEYEHFSKHILDKEYPYKGQGRFPVEDSVNVNFYFYRRDKVNSIF